MAKLPIQANPRIAKTFGETFADGSVIELVRSASSDRLALLIRNAGRKTIATQVSHSGFIYQPPDVDETILRATRFPRDERSYGSNGKLFRRIRDLFERHAGLTQTDSALMTAWVASSWFSDFLSSPPILLISGPDIERAIGLFRLLHCVCRRAVVLGDINRSALVSLASFGATLLINGPSLSARIRGLWSTSNYRGVYVVGNGKACSFASSKAVFLGMTDARGDEGIHFALRPPHCDLSLLTEEQLREIADELQPQLLMFRLKNFERVRNFSACEQSSTPAESEASRALTASVLGDAEIVESIAPILQRLAQDTIAQRECDVHLAVVEASWAPCHKDREITVSRLTELTNTLLSCRGELLEFSAAEIGWKLRNLGFRRHRNGRGMVLKFSQENRILLHQLAVRWSLNLRAVADCALCSPGEGVDQQRLV